MKTQQSVLAAVCFSVILMLVQSSSLFVAPTGRGQVEHIPTVDVTMHPGDMLRSMVLTAEAVVLSFVTFAEIGVAVGAILIFALQFLPETDMDGEVIKEDVSQELAPASSTSISSCCDVTKEDEWRFMPDVDLICAPMHEKLIQWVTVFPEIVSLNPDKRAKAHQECIAWALSRGLVDVATTPPPSRIYICPSEAGFGPRIVNALRTALLPGRRELLPAQIAAFCEDLISVAAVQPWVAITDYEEDDDVDSAFKSRYCYTELIGPLAMIQNGRTVAGLNDSMRLGVYFQDTNCVYPAHKHATLEQYVILTGTPDWQRGQLGTGWHRQQSGNAHFHEAWEPHCFRTENEPFLAMWSWTAPEPKESLMTYDINYCIEVERGPAISKLLDAKAAAFIESQFEGEPISVFREVIMAYTPRSGFGNQVRPDLLEALVAAALPRLEEFDALDVAILYSAVVRAVQAKIVDSPRLVDAVNPIGEHLFEKGVGDLPMHALMALDELPPLKARVSEALAPASSTSISALTIAAVDAV